MTLFDHVSYFQRLLRISPYSPLAMESDEDCPTVQQKPKLSQILRSKQVRVLSTLLVVVCAVTVLSYGRESILNFESLKLPTKRPHDAVDWSRFAYTQYVTNTAYLCNSVMLFEILHRLGSKADRLMMYPSSFHLDHGENTVESRLLLQAQKEYGVKLMPIEVQRKSVGDRKGPFHNFGMLC